MNINQGDNQRQIMHDEDTIQSGEPEQTTLSQTQREATNPSAGAVPPVPLAPAQATYSARQSTTQARSTTTPPSDQYVSRSASANVLDPAADRAATVDWVSRVVWFLVGLMAALIAIRFVLLAAGANENAGFAKLIYGLTGWMVAPFATLFGNNLTYPGAAGTGNIEIASLTAIVVYVLVGLLLTRLAILMLGTNRTTGTVYSETKHQTRV